MEIAIGLIVALCVAIGGGIAAGRLRKRAKADEGIGAASSSSKKVSARSIDAFALAEPWRRHVASAQSAQRRFQSLVASIEAGPLRTRMAEIGLSVNKGVFECWEIAKRGDALDGTLRSLDPASIKVRLERAKDGVARRSLESQMKSVERVRTARDEADDRLRTLQTRLGELVSQAAEVSIGVDHTAELGSAVDEVVVQLEALRLAVREVSSIAEISLPSADQPTTALPESPIASPSAVPAETSPEPQIEPPTTRPATSSGDAG